MRRVCTVKDKLNTFMKYESRKTRAYVSTLPERTGKIDGLTEDVKKPENKRESMEQNEEKSK